MSVNIYEDMGLGGSGRKVPAVEGVSVPWEEGKGFGVGHMNLMAVAAGTGDRQHPAAELLFVQTHAPVLWRSPEATRYKQVSWAGNGKRAKEPRWAREGIWAALELGSGWGISPRSVLPLPPVRELLAPARGTSRGVVFSSPLPFGKSKPQ